MIVQNSSSVDDKRIAQVNWNRHFADVRARIITGQCVEKINRALLEGS